MYIGRTHTFVCGQILKRSWQCSLNLSNGSSPDRISLDTYTPSRMAVAGGGAGEVAEQAKCLKYSALESKFFFVLIAIESSGAFAPKHTHS